MYKYSQVLRPTPHYLKQSLRRTGTEEGGRYTNIGSSMEGKHEYMYIVLYSTYMYREQYGE